MLFTNRSDGDRHSRRVAASTLLLTVIIPVMLTTLACDSGSSQSGKPDSDAGNDASKPVAETDSSADSEPMREPPVDSRPGMAGQQGLNIIAFTPQLISGAVPEDAADFALLSNHKVKTIISVDGATPNVEEAQRFDMRYVHLPIGYHGIDKERQLEIARAVRDLPGPVYVHCHHGKHRGPAATASAAVALGMLPNEQAIMLMRHAGTSPSYAGLYKSVEALRKVDDSELDAVSDRFPEVAPIPDFVKAMADISHAYDHLRQVQAADWQVPAHHPDLVPLAEAGRLENRLRILRESDAVAEYPPEFAQLLKTAWMQAGAFETLLKADAPAADRSAALDLLGQSCKNCHSTYRNNK